MFRRATLKRLGHATTLLLVFAVLWAATSHTQEKYPSRLLKIIVPYGPGGATDIVARVLADELKNTFGQTFLVENKPGAYGIIALQELARSNPDGYTLMIGNVSTNAITPILYANKMTIDYARNVVPVTRLVDIPAFLVATTDAMRAPAVATAFKAQGFNVVATDSLDEAKAWLAGQINDGRAITQEVKIDVH